MRSRPGRSAEEMLKSSDVAMHHAKRKGRTPTMFRKEMNDELVERMEMETGLQECAGQ